MLIFNFSLQYLQPCAIYISSRTLLKMKVTRQSIWLQTMDEFDLDVTCCISHCCVHSSACSFSHSRMARWRHFFFISICNYSSSCSYLLVRWFKFDICEAFFEWTEAGSAIFSFFILKYLFSFYSHFRVEGPNR